MFEIWSQLLLSWFERAKRTLPWRTEPTPYRVLVSEYMLQQTQVATVIPYFNRFLEAFPTVSDLAAADIDSVLKLWEGLGYYSRARHLHQCACEVVRRGGEFPSDPVLLAELPGIGPYTAAAVASIAFNIPVPVVDGNVLRVYSRMTADAESVDETSVKKKIYNALLEVIQTVASPSFFNQAMMELGALVCHPQGPDCGRCPLSGHCRAYQQGEAESYPVRRAKPVVPHYHVAVGVIYDRAGRFLILRRDETQMLGGLWEFPGGKLEAGETPVQAAEREVLEETGLRVRANEEIAVVNHAYSHFKITMHALRCELISPKNALTATRPHRWISLEEISQYAFPKANHKLFEKMNGE